ncbi:MAG: iron uptake porin [Symploca sp. SIO2B6]|nr:iron uptake porin [Symploca sp. SIO2B6]
MERTGWNIRVISRVILGATLAATSTAIVHPISKAKATVVETNPELSESQGISAQSTTDVTTGGENTQSSENPISDTLLSQSLPMGENRANTTPGVNRRNLRVFANGKTKSLNQVTNVSQLRDVSPGDWAYEALRSLVERYGCIAGYPDGTFRGNRTTTRFEFAAGLNACLNQIERLIIDGSGDVSREDLQALGRLIQEFEAELATLGTRVDNLEDRVQFLEDNQFSTTTKLVGEVAFLLADAFGDDVDVQTVFQEKIRLQFVTSFTGKDKLYTRLTTGSIGNSFADELGTNEGRFAFDGPGNNDVTMDRIHYVFPVNDNLQATVMANLGGHHFYADTFNPGLEAGGGANGALSRFAERNPIYRFGLGGQGLGLRYKFSNSLEFSGGYLARGGNVPTDGSGLFNGNYSAMAQLVFAPFESFKIGLTYLNGYDVESGRRFAFGGTGTNLGNLAPTALEQLGVEATPVSSNSYGIETLFKVSPSFNIRGWAGLTKARLIGLGDADIINYSLIFAFPDLGKQGSLGAVVVGAEPYLIDLEVPGDDDFEEDVPFHVEAFYKYKLTDNISITPGVIWLAAPNQDEDNDDVFIGALRTTFSF